MHSSRTTLLATTTLLTALASGPAVAQCPDEPQLDNHTGAGTISCPCFAVNEEAGAIFDIPPDHFPIEITHIGIGWGAQFGSGGSVQQDSIKVYEGGLPDPGVAVYELPGPELIAGFINDFNLENLGGAAYVNSGPVSVTIRFLEGNAGNPFAPSVVHDGMGCTAGRNVVKEATSGWVDACSLGISGDWVYYIIYRKTTCGGGSAGGAVPDGNIVAGNPLMMELLGGGDLSLTWDASCALGDDDYAVYAGTLGSFPSHFSKVCSTAGNTSVSFTPSGGDRYYLVVPRSSAGEGSYGYDSDGVPRPTGGGACDVKNTESCP